MVAVLRWWSFGLPFCWSMVDCSLCGLPFCWSMVFVWFVCLRAVGLYVV